MVSFRVDSLGSSGFFGVSLGLFGIVSRKFYWDLITNGSIVFVYVFLGSFAYICTEVCLWIELGAHCSSMCNDGSWVIAGTLVQKVQFFASFLTVLNSSTRNHQNWWCYLASCIRWPPFWFYFLVNFRQREWKTIKCGDDRRWQRNDGRSLPHGGN